MEPQEKGKALMSVWTWVGILFTILGTLITGMGFYYLANPAAQQIVMPELNPSLWWGAVMLVFGLIMLFVPRLFADKE